MKIKSPTCKGKVKLFLCVKYRFSHEQRTWSKKYKLANVVCNELINRYFDLTQKDFLQEENFETKQSQ